MGCNYYAIPKATDELKKKIIDAVEADDFLLAAELIPQSVHIGKSYTGWQFRFNHNDWQLVDKIEEMKAEYEYLHDTIGLAEA